MKNEQFIEHMCLLLEQKTFWGKADSWTEKNFKRLSVDIAKVSDITVSALTLKRITGKIKTQDSYQPQEASLDGICMYLGYESWEEFRQTLLKASQEQYGDFEGIELPIVTPPEVRRKKKKTSRRLYIGFAAAVVLLLAMGYYWWAQSNSRTEKHSMIEYQNSLSFYADRTIIDNLPASVTLYTDIQDFKEYSDPLKFVYIQNNIIPIYQHKLNRSKIEINEYGMQRAKLFVQNKQISEVAILATTPYWMQQRKKGDVEYKKAVVKDGAIYTYDSGIDENRKYNNMVMWYGPTGVNGDAFDLQMFFECPETSPEKQENVLLGIITQFNKFQLELIGMESTVRPYIRLGDYTMGDLKERISIFRQNISGKHVLKVIKSRTGLKLFLDGNLFYTDTRPIGKFGEVMGFTLNSRYGLKVDRLLMESGNTEYVQDFD